MILYILYNIIYYILLKNYSPSPCAEALRGLARDPCAEFCQSLARPCARPLRKTLARTPRTPPPGPPPGHPSPGPPRADSAPGTSWYRGLPHGIVITNCPWPPASGGGPGYVQMWPWVLRSWSGKALRESLARSLAQALRKVFGPCARCSGLVRAL